MSTITKDAVSRRGADAPGRGGSRRLSSGRPPSAARRRRPALVALAVLLIAGGAALAGLLAVRIDERTPVLVAAREIAVGQLITKDDLATSRVASEGLQLVPADQSGVVVGKYAAQTIPAGRLLDQAMVTQQGFLQAGKAAVGVVLSPGRMPASGLQAGDRVQVVQVKDGEVTAVLADSALVSSVGQTGGDGGGSGLVPGSGSAGASVATVIVDAGQSARVAAASAANQLAFVLLSRGAQLGGNG